MLSITGHLNGKTAVDGVRAGSMQRARGTKEQLQELSSEGGRAVSLVGMCHGPAPHAKVSWAVPAADFVSDEAGRESVMCSPSGCIPACRMGEHKPRNAAGNRAPMNLLGARLGL